MIAELLTEKTVRAWIQPPDWKEAGRMVGAMLVETGGIEPEYIEKMIQNVERLGPYIVIVPGVALFHSRPDGDVHSVCLSLATVRDGVEFGAGKKDPVKLLLAFASVDNKAHLEMLREIMGILKKPELLQGIINAPEASEIIALIRENFS